MSETAPLPRIGPLLAMSLAEAGAILGSGRNTAPTMSIPEAGAILGVGRNKSYDLARQGVIPTIRLGRLLRVPSVGMARLLDRAGEPADESAA